MNESWNRQAAIRTTSLLLRKIQSSRPALIVTAERDEEAQEILDLVNQLEVKLTRYIARRTDEIAEAGE